jgi:hypothetical protein
VSYWAPLQGYCPEPDGRGSTWNLGADNLVTHNIGLKHPRINPFNQEL